jgi:hypothetical protein
MENKKEIIVAIVIVIGIIAGVLGYVFLQNSQDSSEREVTSNNGRAGVVAMFGQQGQPAVQAESTQVPTPVPTPAPVEAEPEIEVVNQPYALNLPQGWERTESDTDSRTCDDEEVEVTIDTYKNGSREIIVYENGFPTGCTLKNDVDVYLDYDFSENGDSMRIATSNIEQCTKDENPDCARGDGRVSVLIGNRNPDNNKQLLSNEKTNKTYIFRITDTQIAPDFESQVKELVTLLQSVEF